MINQLSGILCVGHFSLVPSIYQMFLVLCSFSADDPGQTNKYDYVQSA